MNGGYCMHCLERIDGENTCCKHRKGAHLFRHNLATSFSRHDIPHPVISATLGHVDPDSLDHYLFADIRHLRDCAISIECYPVGKEVFSL